MSKERTKSDDVRLSISSVESFRSIPEDENIKEALKIFDTVHSLNFTDFRGPWGVQQITLVHLAAYCGNLEMLAAVPPADLYAIDKIGRCALHYAACKGNVKVVEWLLEQGRSESSAHSQVSLPDSDGRTALHFAAEAGFRETLCVMLNHKPELLKENPSRFDVQDKDGRTPLHAAVYNGHMQCVRVLISKGLCLANKDHTNKTVVDAIFQKVPQPVAFLTKILDEQVTCPEFGEEVTMEFRMLAALPNTPSPDATAFDKISNLQVLLALITPASMIEPTTIIQHPLVAHFLQTIRILPDPWQIIIVLSMLGYYIALYYIIIYCKTSIDGKCLDLSVVCPVIVVMSSGIFVSRTASFIILLLKSKNCIDRWNFRRFIYVTWLVNLFVNILAVGVSCTARDVFCTNPTCQKFWLEIFLTMLLPWVFIMQILAYYPLLGQYIFMFYPVLYTVLKVLLTFAAVIFSCAYSFLILFPDFDQFSNLRKSLVKILVMMTGEYEYNSLFSNATNSTSVRYNNYELVISSILLLTFVIVINIVLMNLMVGLAVSDINRLLNESRSRWLKVRVVNLLRKSSRRYVIYWIHAKLARFALWTDVKLVRWIHAILARWINELTSEPDLGLKGTLHLRWNVIPEDIKEGIREVALRKASNRDKESVNEMNSPRDNTQEILTTIQSLLAPIESSQAAVESSQAAVESSQAAMQSSLQRMVVEQELQNYRIEQLTQHRKTKWQRKSI